MNKDVLIVIEDQTFYLQYLTRKASLALSVNDLDNVNFPMLALPVIKSHLITKNLTFNEL